MTTQLRTAAVALERDQPARALVSALEAWRACRDPELATAIEALSRMLPQASFSPTKSAVARWAELEARAGADVPEDLEMLVGVELPRSLDAALAWLRLLGSRAPDPRFAAHLHRLMLAPPFGPVPFWRVLFELVAKVGDPRSIAFLDELAPRLPELVRPSALRTVERARAKTSATLRAAYPRVPTLAKARAALERFAALVQARQAAAPVTREVGARLLAAIHADPADDRARWVYADWLQERGDPHGELLALQLRDEAGAAATRRARALIAKHGATWLGPLASVAVASKTIFARGFPRTLGINARTEAMLAAVVGAPAWFSVEEVTFTGGMTGRPTCAAIVTHPVMRSLRVVRGLVGEAAVAVATSASPLRLETFGLGSLMFSGTNIKAYANCEGLPHLRRIEFVNGDEQSPWDMLALAAAPVSRRLDAIALTIGTTSFELRFLANNERSLGIVLRRFGPKERLTRLLPPDVADRRHLATLAQGLGRLSEVEIIVPTPLPDGFEPWLVAILGDLARLPRRITHAA